VAMLAALYAGFAVIGSGLEALLWGLALFASGVPIYFLLRSRRTPLASHPS
jgi:hypothetical protein